MAAATYTAVRIARRIRNHPGLRREAGLRLSPRGLLAGAEAGLVVNGKRALRVMRTWTMGASAPFSGLAEKGLGEGGGAASQSRLAVGHDQDLGRAQCGLGVSGLGDRLLHAGNRGLGPESALSHGRSSGGVESCRAGGSRLSVLVGLTLTTDNGTQFTSACYVETLNRLGLWTPAPAHGLQPSRGQQLHRTVPSQLKRRGGVPNEYQTSIRPSEHCTLDRGVQSRLSVSRILTDLTLHDARARFAQTLIKHGPLCLVWPRHGRSFPP